MSDEYLSNAISLAETKAQYDANVKRVLGDRQVLAWILKYTTKEFMGMEIKEIIPCIENPVIGKAPVLPSQAIEGLAQESAIDGEGQISYDVRFFAVAPDEGKTEVRIIIDVEAQKTPNPGYDIVTRGMFYCGRMLSEQYGRTFVKSDYDSLNKVYSIWVVMNCSKKTANTISLYSINHSSLYGQYLDKARSNLVNVVMIRLPADNTKAIQEPSLIHQVLSTLFSNKIKAQEKKNILEKEYGFEIDEKFMKEVGTMCNLSDNILEQGIEQGIEQGTEIERNRAIEAVAHNLQKEENISMSDALEKAKRLLSIVL